MKRRLICGVVFAAVLIVEICIALWVHDSFIRPYFGDVLAVICVYFLARIFLTQKPKYLSIYVTIFAFLVELIQLTRLSEILPNALSIIVGGTFDFSDLLCYLIGGVACFIADIKFLQRFLKIRVYVSERHKG